MYEEVGQDSENSSDYSKWKSICSLKQHLFQKYGVIDVEKLVAGKQVFIYSVPVSVFCEEMGLLESTIKYLREIKELSFKQIARITKRGLTTITSTYRKALSKEIFFSDSEIKIPVSVIAYRKLSTFESVVLYLKNFENLRFCDISKILCRDPRVIWQVHRSAVNKVGEKHFTNEIIDIIEAEEPGVFRKDLIRVLNASSAPEFLRIFNECKTDDEIHLPLGVFLSRPLSGVVTYLKDELSFPFKRIATLLNRSSPLVVNSYDKNEFIDDFSLSIPLRIIANRKYSIMESVVHYLLTQGMTNQQVAALLKREPSVIITHNKRYEKKNV